MSGIEDHKRTVSSFFSALSGGDIEATLDLMADDAQHWIAGEGPGAGTFSKAEIAAMLPQFAELFPAGVLIKPTGMVAEGNRVAAEAQSSATTATGREYRNLYHFLFEFDASGKIRSIKEYMDTALAARTFAP